MGGVADVRPRAAALALALAGHAWRMLCAAYAQGAASLAAQSGDLAGASRLAGRADALAEDAQGGFSRAYAALSREIGADADDDSGEGGDGAAERLRVFVGGRRGKGPGGESRPGPVG